MFFNEKSSAQSIKMGVFIIFKLIPTLEKTQFLFEIY